jgi:hypothetical protein
MIPLWIKLIAVAALAAAIAGWGYVGGKASVQAKWDAERAVQLAAQLEATEKARATEQALQARVTEANNALQTERSKHARVAATLRTERDGLRQSITGFIRGAATDTISACVERGEAVGVVLIEAVSVAGEFAEAGESCEADKRALIAAWPR